MTRRKHPRFLVPVSIGLMGTALAVAVAVSRGWSAAIGVEVAVFLIAAYLYLLGGNDSDAGAVIGNRADERQKLVRLKAQSLAMTVMYLAALIAWAVAIALKGLYWPFDLIFSCGGITFLIGLQIYGVRADSPIGSTDALQDRSGDPHNSISR